jgi:hypothetical protein
MIVTEVLPLTRFAVVLDRDGGRAGSDEIELRALFRTAAAVCTWSTETGIFVDADPLR